jgi:hypothetical protein
MESRDKRVNEQITNYSSRMFENSPYAESSADSHSLPCPWLEVSMVDPQHNICLETSIYRL